MMETQYVKATSVIIICIHPYTLWLWVRQTPFPPVVRNQKGNSHTKCMNGPLLELQRPPIKKSEPKAQKIGLIKDVPAV